MAEKNSGKAPRSAPVEKWRTVSRTAEASSGEKKWLAAEVRKQLAEKRRTVSGTAKVSSSEKKWQAAEVR